MGKLAFDQKTGEPLDKFHGVYLTAVLCGTAMLLPYNAFIAVPPYVEKYYTYAAANPDYKTKMPDIWGNIENYLLVASLVPNFFGQCAMLTPWGRSLRIFPRLVASIPVAILGVLVVILVPLMQVEEGVALFTLIGCTVVVNIASAILQATFFSFASFFPFALLQGLMLGVGASGSTASILAVIIKASLGNDFDQNQLKAQIYFGLATCILFCALLVVLFLKRNAFAQYYCAELRPEDYQEEEPLHLADEGDTAMKTAQRFEASDLSPTSPASPKMMERLGSTLLSSESIMMDTSVLQVLKIIAPMFLAVFWCYFTTLFVFPAFGVKLHGGEWFGILIILMFNAGDFSGRFLCRFQRLLFSRKVVLAGCALRTLIVAMFFLQVPKYNLIDSVPVAYMTMYSIGITNGFFATQVMMLAPRTAGLETEGERGVCGNAMSVALLGGAAAGSLMSLAIVPQL